MYRTEKYCAEKLKLLCETKTDIPLLDPEAEIQKLENASGIKFAPFQADAIRFFGRRGSCDSYRRTGTGKTTIIKGYHTHV